MQLFNKTLKYKVVFFFLAILGLILFILLSATTKAKGLETDNFTPANSTTIIKKNEYKELFYNTNVYYKVNNDLSITVTDKIKINIIVDGKSNAYKLKAKSVKETLKELNINYRNNDIINADLDSFIYPNETIIIKRVNYAFYPQCEEIKFKTVTQYTTDLFVGENIILQEGTPGAKQYYYADKYVDGENVEHKCINEKLISMPTDKIILKGIRNIEIIQDTYNSDSRYNVLIKLKNENKNFNLPKVKLSDKDRDLLERLLTGEFGSSYVGACLVAQSIKCAIVYDGYNSISSLIKGMGYVGSTNIGKTQNAVNAVKFIFDENGLAVKHRLFYMCTEDYYNATPGNFHSTQKFILQYENVKFFDRWN